MAQQTFDESRWVADLGTALEVLVQKSGEGVVRDSNGVRLALTIQQCRELAQRAESDAAARDAFSTLQVNLNCFPTEVMPILLGHPVIRPALPNPSEDGEIQYIMLEDWHGFQLSNLISTTMKTVIEIGGNETANRLNRFLKFGEVGNLRAYEITVFDELEIDGRADIRESGFLAPYDDVKATYGLPEHKYASSRSLRDTKATPATVFVRKFLWRIAIGPLPLNKEPIVKMEYPFKVSYENAIDLLSITTGKPLTAPTQYIQTLEYGFGTTMITRESSAGMRRGARHLLSEHEVETFSEFMLSWQECRQRHDAVEIAIARLAASLSRTGRFALEDRILDTATALEILFDLGSSELKYKLATRGARLLGHNDQESKSILKTLKTFYDQRSAIVHNGKATKSGRIVATNLLDVSGLARRTLHKLLRDGQPSDWDELVVSYRHPQAGS